MIARYKIEVAKTGKAEVVRRLVAEYEEEVAEFMESARVATRRQVKSGTKKRLEAVCICTMDGRIVHANAQFLDIIGYTMPELVGKKMAVLFINAGDVEFIRDGIGYKGYLIDYRTRLCKKDGSMITCYISSTIRWYNDENVPGNQPLVKSWVRIAR
jgi:PAS domain S-box-containing protein